MFRVLHSHLETFFGIETVESPLSLYPSYESRSLLHREIKAMIIPIIQFGWNFCFIL
jgi:hypothetical protein